MQLETDKFQVFADPLTPAIIASTVATLIVDDESYVILSEADEDYVQAAGSVTTDFIVERRDGCAGEHYRGDRRLTADELIEMLVKYHRGDPAWSHAISWHQVNVSFGALNVMPS